MFKQIKQWATAPQERGRSARRLTSSLMLSLLLLTGFATQASAGTWANLVSSSTAVGLKGNSEVTMTFVWYNYDGDNNFFADQGNTYNHVWLYVDDVAVLDLTAASMDADKCSITNNPCKVFNSGTSDGWNGSGRAANQKYNGTSKSGEDWAKKLCEDYGKTKIIDATFSGNSFRTGRIVISNPVWNADSKAKTCTVTADVVLSQMLVGSTHKIAIKGLWMAYSKDGNSGDEVKKTSGPEITMGAPSVVMPSSVSVKRTGNKMANMSVTGLVTSDFVVKGTSTSYWRYTLAGYKSEPSASQFWDWTDTWADKRWVWKDTGAQAASGSADFNVPSNYDDVVVYPRIRRWNSNAKMVIHDGFSSNGDTQFQSVAYNKDYAAVTLYGYARPKSLTTTADAWNRSIKLSWTADVKSSNSIKDGKWIVFRQYGKNALTKLAELDYATTSYTDKDGLVFNKQGDNTLYTYYVVFQPTAWGKTFTSYTDAEDLSANSSKNITNPLIVTPNVISGDNSITVKIALKDGVKNASSSNPYTFDLYHQKNGGTAVKVKTFTVTSSDEKELVYEENTSDLGTGCDTHTYYLKYSAFDENFTTEKVSGSIQGQSQIVKGSLTASRGNYNGTIKLYWDVDQHGSSQTTCVLYRRLFGSKSETDWVRVNSQSGTASSYSFDDNSAQPGSYYEYKVETLVNCTGNTQPTHTSFDTTDGFAIASGVVSGRVTYGSGTAVEGVKIGLTASDASDESQKCMFRSMEFNGSSSQGLTYATTNDEINQLFGEKSWSVQMFVNPDPTGLEVGKDYQIYVVSSMKAILLRKKADGTFGVLIKILNSDGKIGTSGEVFTIPANKWSNIMYGVDTKKGNWVLSCVKPDGTIQRHETKFQANGITSASIKAKTSANTIKVGDSGFKGQIDEFRLFSGKCLTEEEIKKNYNHRLSGNEANLAIYWPMDEGLNGQTYVYDNSKSTGISNGRHGQINNAITSLEQPEDNQFSLCAYTDTLGNYTVTGVPFNGEGVSYTVRPTLGVHKFQAPLKNLFVSANSLVHSNIDFTDISSFKVKGSVFYEGTTIPVKGANFYVDGTMCAKDGALIESDENGEYAIEVPIGDHYITVKKNGHSFADGGRYPADPNGAGKLYTFKDSIVGLTFTDITKVAICGRIVGGDIETAKPMSISQGADSLRSVNNIGQAQLVLTTSDGMLNATRTVNGQSTTMTPGTAAITFASPSEYVGSTATVGYGNSDACKTITITTDPETGEWAALVPPLKYKMQSCKVINNPNITFDGQLTDIDATNTLHVSRDSVEIKKGAYLYSDYKFVCSNKLTYTSPTTFKLTGKNGKQVYGVEKYTMDGAEHTLYTIDENGDAEYTLDYPVFIQSGQYEMDIFGCQEYVNKDKGEGHYVTTRVPLAGTVVYMENHFAAGNEVNIEGENDGQIKTLNAKQLTLDENGHATYRFKAGFPNINEPYTLNLNINYGEAHQPWSGNGTFKGIVFGALPTGNNFVTKGPDKIDMILRDPCGSGSSAFWEKGKEISHEHSNSAVVTSDNNIITHTSLGANLQTVVGLGVGTIIDSESNDILDVGVNITYEGDYGTTGGDVVTTTQRISTSDEEDYVGALGDVFIGRGTNMIYGKAREVGMHKGEGGTYELGMVESFSIDTEVVTSFAYSQADIVNNTIPELEKIRNTFIQPMGTKEEPKANEYQYISLVPAGDDEFGQSGKYKIVNPSKVDDDKVAQEMVQYYNSLIDGWKQAMANNEKAKVEAIKHPEKYLKKGNVSFDSGAVIESEWSNSESNGTTNETSFVTSAILGNQLGFLINGNGVTVEANTQTGAGYHNTNSSDSTTVATFGYVLAESGGDRLSVDIYEAPDGYGPIFVTRGGITSAPFEDEVVTEYYEPGFVVSARTMQVEVPDIDVEEATMSGVPNGTAALFTLELKNLSEANWDVPYTLELVDESNPNGAVLKVNGTSLAGKGYTVFVRSGETLTQTLALTQENLSIFDYKGIKVRMASTSQPDDSGNFPCIADTVTLNAYFVPACSDIALEASQSVLNTRTDTTLMLKVNNYDKNYSSLKGIRLQYRRDGDSDWTTIRQYTNNTALVDNQTYFTLESAPMQYRFDMKGKAYPDGQYYFRAQTICNYGGEEVNCESDYLTVTKDITTPQLISSPSPASGILTADGELSILFNEDIRSSQLSKSENFYVRAKLNGSDIAHDGVLALQSAETARTEAAIDLANRDFALNLWMNYTTAGNVFAHGTGDTKFTAKVDATGHLAITIGSQTYTSTKTIPAGKWGYLMLNYSNPSTGSGQAELTANYAYDATTLSLFQDKDVAAYTGNGVLALGGSGYVGSIHDVTLWNTNRSMTEAQSEMYTQKIPSTPGLIGYWKLDEGHGATGNDCVRSRHMILPSSNAWHMENVNYALQLNGATAVGLDVSSAICSDSESYMLETWVKAAKTQTNSVASIFSWGEKAMDLRIKSGTLELATDKTTKTIPAKVNDGEWHHIALNVRKATSGSAILYVDGKAVQQLSVAEVPALQTDRIIIGGHRKMVKGIYQYDQQLNGFIDEVRYWKGNVSSDIILSNMYNRLDGENAALAGYYPFEKLSVDNNSQANWTGSLLNAAQKADTRKDAEIYGTKTFTNTSAMALKTAPELKNVDFSFVTNERKILINLETEAAKLEGTTVEITVRDVRDNQNNIADPITWTAYVQQNQLKWEESAMNVTKEGDNSVTFEAKFTNNSGKAEDWTISGMPSWISVDVESGTLQPLASRTVRFTVDAGTAIGTHEAVVYLTGSLGINAPLAINVLCLGETPDWAVNPADYEYSMTVNGQLTIDGFTSQDASDIVAAFRGTECVGVAKPVYFSRYDAYYVLMNVYGNSEDEGKALTYKVYDASTGKTYPNVDVSNKAVSTFYADNVVGTMAAPNMWTSTNKIEQSFDLKKGWQWISFSVDPDKKDANSLLSDIKDKANKMISERLSWTSVSNGITAVAAGQTYKLQMKEATAFNVVGTPVDLSKSPLTVKKNGWSWIGYSGTGYISLNEAFAELQPQNGDMVKSQTAFATWNDYEWVGSLAALQNGAGYQYYTDATTDRTFHYPTVTSSGASRVKAKSKVAAQQNELAADYRGNMNVIAQVVKDGSPLQAKVSVVDAEGRLRGISEQEIRGLHFLTIAGNTDGERMSFIVEYDGVIYHVPGTMVYDEDTLVGDMSAPLLIDLDSTTGISHISADDTDADFVYDLSGRRTTKAASRQVVIKGGKKVVK